MKRESCDLQMEIPGLAVDRVNEGEMTIRKPVSTTTVAEKRTETRSLREILAPAEEALLKERRLEKDRRRKTERPGYDFWSFRVRF